VDGWTMDEDLPTDLVVVVYADGHVYVCDVDCETFFRVAACLTVNCRV